MQSRLGRVRGLSLVELVVALSIFGAVVYFFTQQTSAIYRVFSRGEKRVEMSQEAAFLQVQLTEDLKNSFFHKMGFFRCKGYDHFLHGPEMLGFRGEQVKLVSTGDHLDFITARYSQIVSYNPISRGLVVTDPYAFRVDDILLLSYFNSEEPAGLFLVDKVDSVTNEITLIPYKMAIPEYACVETFISRPLVDIFRVDKKSVIVASKLIPVRYSLLDNTLLRITFSGGGSPISRDVLASFVESAHFEALWIYNLFLPSLRGGEMFFTISVNFLPQAFKKYGLLPKNIFYVRYRLNPVDGLRNPYSGSGTFSGKMKYPSCLISAELRPNAIRPHPSRNSWRNMLGYVLEIRVSEHLTGAYVQVNLLKNTPQSRISCFLHNAKTLGPYPGHDAFYDNDPVDQGTLFFFNKATGFDVFTCGVTGSIKLQGNLTFFDESLGSIRTLDCTGLELITPSRFRFKSSHYPSCSKRLSNQRSINFKNIASHVVGVGLEAPSFGNFSFDPSKGCEWNSSPDYRSRGLGDDCRIPPSPSAQLRRIYLYPYRVDIFKVGGFDRFPDGAAEPYGAYVDCN
ncbi:MAG: hypothetical protein NZ480_00025 [Bdellovibrionaceae bacterium]|nr:hypothetical protein [Pseudobdellovibrionaceae bacterium]MDW8189527.1 hypothetical protein [Pseudobdellovibrionaceae bacterium]